MNAKAVSILSTTALFITMMLLVACQRSEAPQNADPVQPLYLGNLDQKMGEIYNDKNKNFLSVCDYQWRSKILEISRVLEEKREAIEALAQKDVGSEPEKVLDFGSYKFLDDSLKPPGKDEWTERINSWSRIAKIYDWIKDDPKDPRWVIVNQMARGIVSDDDKRIVRGVFYSLSRKVEPMVLEIERKAVACQQVASCVNPNLSKEETNFLTLHPFYANANRIFRSDKATFEQKRENLERFAMRVQSLAQRYGFYQEDLLKIDGKALTVPMDLSALGDEGAARFIEITEKIWNTNPDYSIKIESIKGGSPAYTVQVDEAVGGRAHLNRKSRAMQLFNWDRVKVFTHEFGHILGFQDNYYTAWSIDTCSYTTETNSGDLMANSSDGTVLTRHWDKLKEIYWPAPKPTP